MQLVGLWLGGYPQLSDHLGLRIACKLEGAGVTESEKGMTMSPSVSPLIESDMTAIENVGRCRSRKTAGVVLNPHPVEVHWHRGVSDPARSRKES